MIAMEMEFADRIPVQLVIAIQASLVPIADHLLQIIR